MSRNKALTFLQKTYDDSYLSCSTAVYHESQGNELEAMRHWKGALDQIYEHNAVKVLPTYTPRSDTEKALMDALKQLELQCKERIDLLEALRVSRQDSPGLPPTGKASKSSEAQDINSALKGSIGQGTIPAVSYSDLSRPTLPHRPSLPARPSTEAAIGGSSQTSNHQARVKQSPPSLGTPQSRSPARPAVQGDSSRTKSPDKYTMRTTLRSGRPGEKSSKSSRKSSKPAAEGPSKAATLAWSTLTSREKVSRNSATSSEKLPLSSVTGQRHSSDQPRKPSASQLHWDSNSRRLVPPPDPDSVPNGSDATLLRHSDEYLSPSHLSVSAASSALTSSTQEPIPPFQSSNPNVGRAERYAAARVGASLMPSNAPSREKLRPNNTTSGEPALKADMKVSPDKPIRRAQVTNQGAPSPRPPKAVSTRANRARPRDRPSLPQTTVPSSSDDDNKLPANRSLRDVRDVSDDPDAGNDHTSDESLEEDSSNEDAAWKKRKEAILKDLPPGVDESAAKQILNDIVVQGDEVRWGDIAGLEVAKNALREAVVYPFLRPDLFMGLREPARGMLLFGPPGTGKTMLARAVATESRSTFFSISASSLTSKFLGESEKLVRALFGLAKVLAPSIIFVDEIDSLLSSRSGSGEHEATRRIKTEFLIQWSDLQRAAAGRETTDRDRERGDANRVLVLAATNLPWAIDEAARRRFVRRQYIPLPEPSTRETQLRTLLGQQKHGLCDDDIAKLVSLTEGFSGSDITALAKDAAMGPLRSLGDALLHMTMDDIRPITLFDFETSLSSIRPSVSKSGLKEYEDWATEFGERGG